MLLMLAAAVAAIILAATAAIFLGAALYLFLVSLLVAPSLAAVTHLAQAGQGISDRQNQQPFSTPC
jgi:hypothetical protein